MMLGIGYSDMINDEFYRTHRDWEEHCRRKEDQWERYDKYKFQEYMEKKAKIILDSSEVNHQKKKLILLD